MKILNTIETQAISAGAGLTALDVGAMSIGGVFLRQVAHSSTVNRFKAPNSFMEHLSRDTFLTAAQAIGMYLSYQAAQFFKSEE